MSQKSNGVAFRASLLYGLIAAIWIILSDRFLGELIPNKDRLMELETYKGWAFVTFTALLLFLIMQQLLRRESQKIAELKKSEALTRLQNEILQMIASGKPLTDTLEVLLLGIEAESPTMLVSVLLLDSDGVHLRHGAAPSLPEAYIKAVDGVAIGPKVGSCGTAAFRGSPVFVSDIAKDPLWTEYKHLALPHQLRSCWSTPILDEHKKVLGTFAIYHHTPGLPQDADVRLIEVVTHTVATAIIKERVEKKLRGSEERFRTLVEQASDAIFVHDTDGHLLDVNQSACESLGYSRKELLRMTVVDFEQDVKLLEAQKIWRTLQAGHSQIVRGRHRRKNGTIFPVEVNVTCYEVQGRLVLAALTRNISERKEYENQLAQSVSLLRATIESSVSGLLVVDMEGKITIYNNRFLEMWRIPAELMAAGDDQTILKVVMDQLKDAEGFLKRTNALYQQPTEDAYDTLQFKDGRVYDRVARPQRLGDKIIGRVWSFRDVTQQQRAEKSMRLQSVALATAANAILITDVHGDIEWVNPAFTASSGYAFTECTGKNPGALVRSGKHDSEFYRTMWQTILAGDVWHGEITNRRKDGSFYLEEMTITPLRDEQNQITHFVAIKQDITERRQMEESLWKSSQMLNVVLDNMPMALFWKDRNSVFLGCSNLVTKNAGLESPEKIIGLTDRDLPWFAEAGSYEADDRQVMETGVPKHNIEESQRIADGRILWLRTSKVPLRNPKGEIIGILGTFEDITERKLAEEKLRQAVERSEFYVARMPLAFIAFDRDFHVAEWNPAAEEIFGWSTAEALGQHAYKLIVPPEVQPHVDEIWAEIITTGNMASHSVNENLTKHGKRITCEWRNTPWRDASGQICGSLSIVTDITEKLRAEKERQNLEAQLRQSQKMEAVGQLSGGIAHDFNNILTVIQGNAALLQGLDLQPSEIRDCSNQIARAGERAAGLTRQLLMFARKQQMQPVNLDLNETVAQMTKMLQRILGEDIALRSEYSPALPLINADVGMIEQIILNLAVNARDAMPGGGRLSIRTRVENFKPAGSPENTVVQPRVCLSMADTGSGIAPEILARIFEPFFTTKEVGKGTGLGLATVYGIVQQHHADITVQSETGKGTTFNTYFPIVVEAHTEKSEAKKISPALPWGTETILLVEDEFPLRTFVSDLLQRCGYTVLEAESGPAALKVWHAHHDRIQLVLTDIIMPENLNGIELGRQLLADKPSLKVIYTSGYTGNLEGRAATLTEGVNFIRKPFKPEAIAEIIRKNLDGKTRK